MKGAAPQLAPSETLQARIDLVGVWLVESRLRFSPAQTTGRERGLEFLETTLTERIAHRADAGSQNRLQYGSAPSAGLSHDHPLSFIEKEYVSRA